MRSKVLTLSNFNFISYKQFANQLKSILLIEMQIKILHEKHNHKLRSYSQVRSLENTANTHTYTSVFYWSLKIDKECMEKVNPSKNKLNLMFWHLITF